MRKALFFITLLLLISGYIPAYADSYRQQGDQLPFGETVTGEITTDEFRQLYTFSGNEGQVIAIRMTRVEGDLDPVVLLMNTSGVVLSYSDDEDEGRNALISSQRLPANGTYVVIATRFGHEHGSTTGTYEIRMDSLGATASSGSSLNLGTSIVGEITNERHEVIYTFEAKRGQVINIYMKRTSGNLDPLLDLFDASGGYLISGDDDPNSYGSLNAAILNFMIPNNGSYIIRATRWGYDAGTSSGSFLIELTEIPPETLGTRPANARFMAYDDTVTSQIDNEISIRFFQFEATRGDVISAVATRETGNISPQLSLLYMDLRPISVGTTGSGQEESRISATIPENGRYLLAVSRFRGTEGTSEGEFSLTLIGRQGIGGGDALEIVYEAQVTGIIDTAHTSETYIFLGEEGDLVTITMQRLDGNLDCLLTLQDETGKQLIFNDDIEQGVVQDSRISRFRLPADGLYRIEASRFDRVAGTTSGAYSLTLVKEN
ncbi:MAG: PPC domain-containing protein [Anaerolineae bacterium]|nr:PPC domain-containing protein [Anaerolineae bacterium]